MTRKLSAGLVLAIVLALVLAGVALAAGLNVFDYLRDEDVRYAEIAPQSELATQAPVTVENAAVGTATAFISNAYYDGNSLLVAYTIQNGTRTEPFTPTDAQLAEMTKVETVTPMETAMPIVLENDTADSLVRQYNEALQSGTPFGYITYSVYPSDHTVTQDGDDLAPSTETTDTDADGTVYTIREYETPLPDQEYLKLEIRLWQSVSYVYFDGTNAYNMVADREDAGAMTATVWRADVQRLQMRGSGTWQGAAIAAEAEVSAVHAELTLTADADVFTDLGADQWYEVILQDENGNTLRTEECGAENEHTILASFQGTGSLPESLSVYLLQCSEGDFDQAAALAEATPIVMIPVEE